jgi:hypothetical protein
LGILIAGILFALIDAVFFVGPLTKIDKFTSFTTEGTKAVICIPLMFLAALGAGSNW